MSVIGDNIRNARTKKNMTVKELAKKAGISESALIEVESGKKVPNTQIVQSVSKVLGIHADAIEPSYFSDFFEEPEKVTPVKAAPRAMNPAVKAPITVATIADERKSGDFGMEGTALGSAFSKAVNKIPVLMKINPAKPFPGGQEILDYKLEPVFQGKTLGTPQGEFIYYLAPDNALSNSRILKGDQVLIFITSSILDRDIVLATYNGKTYLRRIKKLDDKKIVLLFPDNPESEVLVANQSEVKVYGKAVRVEFRI